MLILVLECFSKCRKKLEYSDPDTLNSASHSEKIISGIRQANPTHRQYPVESWSSASTANHGPVGKNMAENPSSVAGDTASREIDEAAKWVVWS